jgi:hypothetical protein
VTERGSPDPVMGRLDLAGTWAEGADSMMGQRDPVMIDCNNGLLVGVGQDMGGQRRPTAGRLCERELARAPATAEERAARLEVVVATAAEGVGVDAGADSKPSSQHFESWPRSEWSKKLMHNLCHYTSHISHP